MVLVIFIVLLVLGSTRGMSVSTTGRVCVVTGANKGIGYEVAKIVASTPGWVTVVASRDEARGQRAVEFFRQQGLNAICRQLDITDAQSIETFTRNLAAEYSKVDCLVNNAGIAFKSSDPTPFPQQARPTLETNFFGTVNLTQKLLPLILKSDEPRIVQVASGSGHISILPEGALKDTFMALERGESDLTLEGLESIANQFIADISASKNLSEWPNSCYGMSKLCVIAYAKILARDEPRLKVNSCSPGYCKTDMTSHKGPRPPEQGARTPAMLAVGKFETLPSGKFFADEQVQEW